VARRRGNEGNISTNLALFAYSSLLWLTEPHRAVFDRSEFPQLSPLEEGWRSIRREFEALDRSTPVPVLHEVLPGHERLTGGEGWRVGVLRVFGRDVESCRSRCPSTAALLDGIPGLVSAMFSVLEPGVAVPWHPGSMKGVIRCHLPLVVPSGDTGLQIGRSRHRWEEGRLFLFDDSYLHRVWNRTESRRVILLIDLERQMANERLEQLNRWVLRQLRDSRRFRAMAERADLRTALADPEGAVSAKGELKLSC